MRSPRWLLLWALGLSAAMGCSSTGTDDDPGAGGGPQAGAAGKAGSAGKAGTGGTAGTAGKGGGAGTGGTAGTAGTAGSGGSAGTAGSAGSAGNAGAAGMSGASGQAGDAGAGGAADCVAPKKDCDGTAATGCEINVATDPKNCGECGNVCPAPDNSLGVCIEGKCATACQPGYASCDGVADNGCEVQTSTSPDHCGFCGNMCPSGQTEAALCTASVCTLECAGTLRDCNLDVADGCETDVSNDPQNCGNCGQACGGGAQCVQNACQCAGTSAAAEPVQLAMYVMLDKSGSMLDQIAGGSTRWETVKSALNQFFASPEGAGIKVALSFFPLEAPAGTACDQPYYYTPSVAMSALPGPGDAQTAALSAAMAATTPSGGTPTQVALAAALQYASDWKKAFPKEKTIVLLATDGQPGDGCNATLENSTAAADAGFKGSPPVPTYVIGVGAQLSNLDTIAQAGGTAAAFLVNDGNTAAFLEALKQIKLQAVACEFALPASPDGSNLDYNKVNVQYTPGGGATQLFGNATDAAACADQTTRWYYDDALAPTKILLCPATCAVVQSDPAAQVSILLGCETKKD